MQVSSAITCGLVLITLLVSTFSELIDICPIQCACKKIKQTTSDGNFSDTFKVRCGGTDKEIISLKDIRFGNMTENIVQLDLSRNQLSHIDPNFFVNLINLKRLDLSSNSIRHIDVSIFRGLVKLERLKLNQNLITTILSGTFDKLQSLKQLDITSNPLNCNCEILWITEWSSNKSIRLSPAPKCSTPSDLKSTLLKRLRLGIDLQCESREQNHIILKPHHSQVVFEGDPLRLHCLVSSTILIDDFENYKPTLSWGWIPTEKNDDEQSNNVNYKNPASEFTNVIVTNRYLSDSGLVDSWMKIDHIYRNQSGSFNCQLTSVKLNYSKLISVIVISNETKYCKGNITRDNKGVYSWPETVVGHKVELFCQGEGLGAVKAMHTCKYNGLWEMLNTSSCPYISETTKILEQFAKVNLSLTKGSVLESARGLRNFTALDSSGKLTTRTFQDPMDAVFISKTIENYLEFVPQEKELGSMLVDVGSQAMKLPQVILRDAQEFDGACGRFVSALERAATHTPSLQTHKSNLALEEFKVKRDGFTGITCSWHSVAETRVFHCSSSNRTTLQGPQGRLVEASIQVPASLFRQLELQGKVIYSTQHLLVAMYENNSFFPKIKLKLSDKLDVTSCVVGVKLGNTTVTNLTDPVYITLRVPPFHNVASTPKPVWWNGDLYGGKGGWSQEGCHFSHSMQGLLIFSCDRLGYYGLMQDTQYLNDFWESNTGARFRFLHPAIYVGSIILFICLLVSIVTYITCFSSIQMAKKAKHSLINTWVALLLLCFMYTLGIYQTEAFILCQSIGIILHYLSLSSLLWMTVTVSNMYKRLSKNDSTHLQEDELPNEVPVQKPILGLYLVGWGVALIVCGISGAVNMREYASYSYCFLVSAPALSAVFVPAAILIIILWILFLIIRCTIRNIDVLGQMSEGTQATENVDLDLLEPSLPNNLSDRHSVQSVLTPSSSDVEDSEHSPITQLKAHAIVLFMYLAMWSCGGIAIAKPFNGKISYEEDLFSVLYAIMSSTLGVFIIFFYGIARSDVRNEWILMQCFIHKRKQCCRTRSVSDTKSNIRHNQTKRLCQIQLPPITNQEAAAAQAVSRSNSQNSNPAKNLAYAPCNSNIIKAAADLNGQTLQESPPGAKMGNVNLVVLHRQQYRSNNSICTYPEPGNCADMFYNPNQSNVARKFFKKQKRNMKRNNIEIRQRGDGGATSDGGSVISHPRPARENIDIPNNSIFGSGSKVNNTNIHVDTNQLDAYMKDSRQQQNPNILSDSCNESEIMGRNTPQNIERLVMGAGNLRASMNNRQKIINEPNPNIIANIYTNVPETAHPQHQRISLHTEEMPILTEENEADEINFKNKNTSGESLGNKNQNNLASIEQRPGLNYDSELSINSMHLHSAKRLSLSNFESVQNQSVCVSPEPSVDDMENHIETFLTYSKAISNSDVNYAEGVFALIPNENILDQNHRQLSKSLDTVQLSKRSDFIPSKLPKSTTFINSSENVSVKYHFPNTFGKSSGSIQSPVLFSPSMCEINDLPSPNENNHLTNSNEFFVMKRFRNSESQNCDRLLMQSPTFESDINFPHYEASEISIQSHGLYAPQPDLSGTDLIIGLSHGDSSLSQSPNTTIGRKRPHSHYGCHTSEVSAISSIHSDDGNYSNTGNLHKTKNSTDLYSHYPHSSLSLNSATDSLIRMDSQEDHDSHTSIDELYQQITRRTDVGRNKYFLRYQHEGDSTPHPQSASVDADLNACSRSPNVPSTFLQSSPKNPNRKCQDYDLARSNNQNGSNSSTISNNPYDQVKVETSV